MSNIDRQVPTFTDTGSALPRTTSTLNRQSWLNALESAGLRDALRVAKSFVSAETGGIGPSNLPSGQASSPESSMDREVDDRPSVFAKRHQSRSEDQKDSTIDSGTRRGCHSRAPNSGQPQAFRGVMEQTLGAECFEHETNVATWDSLPTAPEAKRHWKERNVTVLPSEQGMEVWIRDSRLRDSRLATLLGTLRNTMAELGTSLVRVSLNGKPVQLHAQVKPGERKSKEG